MGMLNAMRRKEILFPELSYANADHTRLKRWFIRSVEGLSGRDRYARLYEIWRRDIAPTGDRIFGRMLELIDVVGDARRINGRRRICPIRRWSSSPTIPSASATASPCCRWPSSSAGRSAS